MAQTIKKKYVGLDAAGILAQGIKNVTPRTWKLPMPTSEDKIEVEDYGVGHTCFRYATPEAFREILNEIKIGDNLDVGVVIGTDVSLPVLVPIVGVEDDGNVIMVSADIAGSEFSFTITKKTIQYEFKINGASWGSSLQGIQGYPNWGDAGDEYTGGEWRPCWNVSEDLNWFTFGDTINIALKANEPYDPEEPKNNRLIGRLLSKSTIGGSDETYGTVVGVARIATPGSGSDYMNLPGIFVLSHKSEYGAMTKVTFFPLMNKWQDYYNLRREVKNNAKRISAMSPVRPPRVIVGRIPRLGWPGTHNFYLVHRLNMDRGLIPVRLSTRKFLKWANSDDMEPFRIWAVGVESAFFSCGTITGRPLKVDLPFTVAVDAEGVTISKKSLDYNSLDPYGLHALMRVRTPEDEGKCYRNDKLIVRYDEERGWIGFPVPTRDGAFAIDKLTPPTHEEVINALHEHLNGRKRNSPYQIQFRSRAIRPKGATATEATRRYHFWSNKKKRGTVFRIRRTYGYRLRRPQQEDDGAIFNNNAFSNAHRNFGASEWHYYSVKWGRRLTNSGSLDREVVKLRRL